MTTLWTCPERQVQKTIKWPKRADHITVNLVVYVVAHKLGQEQITGKKKTEHVRIPADRRQTSCTCYKQGRGVKLGTMENKSN